MVMGELPVETDVLVIGGGPGGYGAAFRAADLGLDVTLVNDEPKPGGVCLLRGCIPSKGLLYITELIYEAQAAAAMGVEFQRPKVKLDTLRSWKDQLVDGLADGLVELCQKRDVRLVQGRARFDGSRQVRLQDSELAAIQFKHAIIATGSRPLPLPGTEFKPGGRVMDSATALALAEIPKTLLVVGGGYVGLELGMVYAALGSRVTLVEMGEGLMPGVEEDLVEPLLHRIEELFEGVYFNTKVAGLKEGQEGVEVQLEGQGQEAGTSFERVLVAVGRRPNSDDLGLDRAGVELDEGGFIQVDKQRRTTAEHIFAVGDAAGGMLLAHKAMYEGKVAAEVIAGQPGAFDARAVPAVVYTDPQIAWCGLTEAEAKAEGREVQVARYPWRASGRARSMGAGDGLTKLIVEPQSQRLLGVAVVGREAEALIAEGVLAIEMGAVARDLALVIHPHPTLSETLGEAAETFLGGATHLGPRRDASQKRS